MIFCGELGSRGAGATSLRTSWPKRFRKLVIGHRYIPGTGSSSAGRFVCLLGSGLQVCCRSDDFLKLHVFGGFAECIDTHAVQIFIVSAVIRGFLKQSRCGFGKTSMRVVTGCLLRHCSYRSGPRLFCHLVSLILMWQAKRSLGVRYVVDPCLSLGQADHLVDVCLRGGDANGWRVVERR